MLHLNLQALSLDDGQVYKERLEVMLHRLELRSELYKQPERPEDIAGMIIEQVHVVPLPHLSLAGLVWDIGKQCRRGIMRHLIRIFIVC